MNVQNVERNLLKNVALLSTSVFTLEENRKNIWSMERNFFFIIIIFLDTYAFPVQKSHINVQDMQRNLVNMLFFLDADTFTLENHGCS